MVVPSGRLFSKSLEIWPGSSVREYFEKAADLVDGLHGMSTSLSKAVPNHRVQCCGKQPLRTDRKQWPRCEGRVFFTVTREPFLIYVNQDGDQPLFAAVHEFGHLVHYASMAAGRDGAGHRQMDGVLDWLKSTSTCSRLEQLCRDPKKLLELEFELVVRSVVNGGSPTRLEMPISD